MILNLSYYFMYRIIYSLQYYEYFFFFVLILEIIETNQIITEKCIENYSWNRGIYTLFIKT